MSFSFLDEEPFLAAVRNRKATLFLGMDMPEVTWDEVLQFVNDYDEKRRGKKLLSSPYAFFHDEAQVIAKVNSFVKQVHKRYQPCYEDPDVVTCQLFGSTKLEEGQMIHKHEDRENNLFWQGKGKSRWRLYGSFENEQPFMDVILEERDLLYIPGGTVHIVEPITPRFGFAVLFGDVR
jgi:cupin superfamily acireductone dioxygenase involved in methionine salvage